jgi:hypothetical protein
LDLPEDDQNIFDKTVCCSDTEQLPNGTLQRIQCSWRSPMFSLLGHQLDQFYKKNKAEKLGKRYKYGDSFLLLRQKSDSQERTVKVPSGLPKNCYNPNFLASLSQIDVLLLQPKPEIDFAAIIQKISPS